MNDFRDLKERVENLNRLADMVSRDVRQAEAMLQQLPLSKTVQHGPLTWDADKRRIMQNEKPLIENKLQPRMGGHFYLSSLVDKVLLETDQIIEPTGNR